MSDGGEFLNELDAFSVAQGNVLVIVQCDVEWFRPSSARRTMEFEYRLARLCLESDRQLEVIRLVPHNLSLTDLGRDPEPIIDFYDEWLESVSTWTRLVTQPVSVLTQRLIQVTPFPDCIQWSTAGHHDSIPGFDALAARIRAGIGMTQIVPADFDVASDTFERDPSLTF